MASQIILDMKDPGVSALVAAWTDGKSYPIPEGTMVQVSQNGDRAIFDIKEIVATETEGGGAVEAEETEEPAAPNPAPKSKPAVQVKY